MKTHMVALLTSHKGDYCVICPQYISNGGLNSTGNTDKKPHKICTVQ